MAKLENITIGKVLGKGYKGTVFLATDKQGRQYALKAEQVFKKDVQKSLKSFIWRSFDFAKTMSEKYPDHFMKIYDYQIDDESLYVHDHKKVKGVENLNEAGKRYYKKLFESPYSLITLTSKVDGIFGEMSFPPKVFYDLFIQYVYIIYLIDKEGYMHCDLHENNIGMVKTDKQTIKILNHDIPTHGYFLQAIDYGNVLSKKFILKASELKRLETDNDLSPPINAFLIKFNTLIKTYKQLKNVNLDDKLYKMPIDKDDWNECKKLLPDKPFYKEKIEESFLIHSLYELNYYEKFERYLLGDKLVKPIPPDLLLPKNIIIYIICNIGDIPAVLKYLIDQRK